MLHLCYQRSTLRVLALNRFLCVLISFSLLEMKAVNAATVGTKIKFLKTYSVCFLKIQNGAACIKLWYLILGLGLSHYFLAVNMFSLIFSMLLSLYYNDKFQSAGEKKKIGEKRRLI